MNSTSKPSPSSAGVPLTGASGQDETEARTPDALVRAWLASIRPPYDENGTADEESRLFVQAVIATLGEHLTPRNRGHLIAALQTEQAAWEQRTGRTHHTGTAGSTTPEESCESSLTSGQTLRQQARG